MDLQSEAKRNPLSNAVRSLDPFSIQGVRAIAGAYTVAKKNDRAIEYYKKAIESEPESFRMRMDLGGDCLKQARYREAAEQFHQVLNATVLV